MQRHLRHSDPRTTLKHYAKAVPESLRAAVAALDAQITGRPEGQKGARATAKPSKKASISGLPGAAAGK